MSFWTLVAWQWRDLLRNPLLALFSGMVIGVGLLMSVMVNAAPNQEGSFDLASFMLVMCAFMIAWQIPALALAEEKEKRAWPSLLLTPLKPVLLVLGRMLLAAAVAVPVGLLMIVVAQRMPARPGLLAAAYGLMLLFTITCGTLAGLLAPDIKNCSFYGTPVMLALIFLTTLPWRESMPRFWAAQAWLPTRPFADLIRAGMTGAPVPIAQHVLVIAVYCAVVAALLAGRMRRLATAGPVR